MGISLVIRDTRRIDFRQALLKNGRAKVWGYRLTTDTGNDRPLGAAFVSAVCADINNSRAVNHPYLRAIRDGDFPDVHRALQDFAFQYGLYNAQFVRYMSAVAKNLSTNQHKKILLANLAEEQGNAHDIDLPPDIQASIEGKSHARLYRRFQTALGLRNGALKATPECPGLLWSQQFLALCKTNECVGVGAIGIGTELIVASIYNQILDGLKAHSNLTMSQRVFFDLHSICDDEHAAQMLMITEGLAQDKKSCEQIEFGVQSAIDLRSSFWDMMHKRAQSLTKSDSHTAERLSAIGHREGL